jgi:ABC-type uncharacterized transport system permease subunit
MTANLIAARSARTRAGVRYPVRITLIVVLGLSTLSATRVISGVDEVTSSGAVGAALRLAVPIALAALSGLWAERAGVANLGIEGMMIAGTWFGAWVGSSVGVWAGVLAAVAAGAVFGLVHAVVTVTFGVDQIISGIAINLLAAGLTRFLSVAVFSGSADGGASQSPPVIGEIGTFTLPVVSGGPVLGSPTPDLLGALENTRWFFLADAAGIARGVSSNVSWLTLIAVLLLAGTAWLLWRTSFGLRLRAAGENPFAADSLGVGVLRIKYVAVVVSGAMAGLAGAFLVTVASNVYREGQTGGRGFIGLAAMIFGNWRPGGAGASSLLFGYADALQLRQGSSVHALVLFAALALVLLAISLVRRRRRDGLILALAGVAAFVIYQIVPDVAPQLVYATPYVVTLIVLAASSQRLTPPAGVGVPYRRGDGG